MSFYIYEIYREFFDVFRILLTKELQCRHQSLSTDKFAGNFQIYALAKIKTTTIHITYLFNTEQTAQQNTCKKTKHGLFKQCAGTKKNATLLKGYCLPAV